MKQRLITALVLSIILIPLVIIGNLPFEIGVTLLSLFSLYEILDKKERNVKIPILIKILSFLSVGLLTICYEALVPCIALIFLIIYIPIIFINSEEYNFDMASFLFGIIMFIGICFHNIIEIRTINLDNFIYVVLITILTDTFAYIGGKLLGKHKLIPKVSPGKTIEGSVIGSLVGTIIPSVYYLFMIDPGMNMSLIILMTLIISIFGQLGDLLFSSIKRNYKIKDFSNIFPGHGGVLDRFDSLLIASLVYVIIRTLFI